MKEVIGSRILRAICLLIAVCLIGVRAQAKYGGGTGEPNDPHQIATAEDLMLLGDSPEDYDKHFILTADIDLDPNLPGREVFDKAVIGNFTGVFDGKGHAICNLTCHSTDQGEREVGLFGGIDDQNAEVRNLRLIDPHVYAEGTFCVGSLVGLLAGGLRNCCAEGGTVTGRDGYVGGLVGYNNGRMVACYSTSTVVGDSDVGGLVGDNYGRVAHCYSSGTVSGHSDVGGLVGYNSSSIADCYSIGPVGGSGSLGGLVGRTRGPGRGSGSAEIDCFWDVETSGQTNSAGGTGLSTAEMQDPNTFIAAGWDFVGCPDGPHDVWAQPLEGRGYPVLYWQLPAGFALSEFSGGTGEPNEPYLIASPDEWNRIGHNPRLMGAHFRLVNDIDLAEVESFVIASEHYPFTGTFDGEGHIVANFSYGPAQHSYVGLFGYVFGRNARVEALGVVDPSINVDWGYGVGSLVGCLGDGTISGCFARGGGISGGGIHVGGLVGRSYSAISDCYTDGVSVSGRGYVGGLVGLAYSPGTVTDCYSSSTVSGENFLGGLVARGPSEYVVASFWDIKTSGQTTSVGGGKGKTTAEMQTASTFFDAGWDFVNVWGIGEGQTYPYLRKYSAADINEDGIVNLLDLCIVAEQWMEERQ